MRPDDVNYIFIKTYIIYPVCICKVSITHFPCVLTSVFMTVNVYFTTCDYFTLGNIFCPLPWPEHMIQLSVDYLQNLTILIP